jgi:hypothetical protein
MHQNGLASEGFQIAPITVQIIQREGGLPGSIPDFQRGWMVALRVLGRIGDGRRGKASQCPSGSKSRKIASGNRLKAGNAAGFWICRTRIEGTGIIARREYIALVSSDS